MGFVEGKGPFPLHDSLHLHILNLLDAVELPGAVAGGGADEMPDFADVDGRFLRGVFAELLTVASHRRYPCG